MEGWKGGDSDFDFVSPGFAGVYGFWGPEWRMSPGTVWAAMRRDYQLYIADPERFAREVLDFHPDAKQSEILKTSHKRVILNWGRQCGKSTVVAAKAVHWAVTQPNSVILVLGGEERHTAGFLSKADHFLGKLGWPIRGQAGKRLSRILPNGSEILTMTTTMGVRGNTASLVILDEAAYINDAVWQGMLPTLATTNGTIIVLSTPNGKTGWYYELWRGGRKWLRSEYRADQNPRIPKAFLDEVRQLEGDSFVRQEFLCEFLEDGRTVLKRENVESLFS